MNDTVATLAGREKLAYARAGIKPLPKITYIAFGDEGISSGVPRTPTNTASDLYHETFKKELTQILLPNQTTVRYSVMLEKNECEGMIFNEMGLIDEEGTLIAIKTFLPTQKDGDMKLEFSMDDEF